MDNTPSHVGRPQVVEALGRQWTFARWDRRIWAEFLDWAKTQLPDPKKQATEFLAMLPAEDAVSRTAIVKDALAASIDHLSVSSPKVSALLNTIEGTTRLAYLLLKSNHPEMTEDAAYDIVLAAGQKAVADMMQKCAGVLEKKEPGPGETSSSDSPAAESPEASKSP